jgi:hypothetical protein
MGRQVKPRKLQRGKGSSVLVFGMPGAGKTRLAATSPNGLIIRPPADQVTSVDFKNTCMEMVVSDWAEMNEAKEYVFTEGWQQHDWVWLDSISLFQDYGLEDVLEDAIRRKPDRAVVKGGIRVVEFGPDKGEYRTNMDRVAKFVRDMQALADEGKIHFGVTAHPFDWYNPVKEEDMWAPWIQGKNMVTKICGYMNLVAYLERVERKGKPDQTLLLSNAKGFHGKDQIGLPEMKSGRKGIVDPTIPKLEQIIGSRSPGAGGKRKRTRKRRKG